MGLVQQLRETYKNKKIFLTGHTGFKGAWLIMLLHELGASVKGYSLEAEPNSLYQLINGDKQCVSTIADIRNLDQLRKEIISFQPDFIFHLAAQALVRTSYEMPIETFETNVMGTANVLEAIRSLQGKCVSVLITTDKVYHNPETGKPFKETDSLGGYDPYSASKAAAEILISSYRNSYFNNAQLETHQKPISSARAGNVIGGGDWSKDRLIPDTIRSLSQNQDVIIRNPEAIRPWQHVLEPLVGYLILAMRQFQKPTQYNEAWNFGPLIDSSLSVKEVVQQIIHQWGSGNVIVQQDESKHEAQLLKLDITKATKLGWNPQLTLQNTLEWTMDWYVEVVRNMKPAEEITKRQIDNYLKLLN